MDMHFWKVLAVIILLLLFAGCLLICFCYRRKKIQKVRRMEMPQKVHQLNELAEPFGFFYEPVEDVFSSRLDAWQREQGYEALFDKAAVGMNMVIDTWPVYFDYQGRTWLIEFWKGQYGINAGGEIGVYRAKKIIPPHLYVRAHFDAVEDDEIPEIESMLMRRGIEVYHQYRRHWWLTGFRMGLFSPPGELELLAALTFWDSEVAQAFFCGLKRSGQPAERYRICGSRVCVRMNFSRGQTIPARVHRFLVLRINHLYCVLFRFVTHPFTCTVDRMIFLYYLLPWCFRHMIKIGGKRWDGML